MIVAVAIATREFLVVKEHLPEKKRVEYPMKGINMESIVHITAANMPYILEKLGMRTFVVEYLNVAVGVVNLIMPVRRN